LVRHSDKARTWSSSTFPSATDSFLGPKGCDRNGHPECAGHQETEMEKGSS
jgi:hypothetical protein